MTSHQITPTVAEALAPLFGWETKRFMSQYQFDDICAIKIDGKWRNTAGNIDGTDGDEK